MLISEFILQSFIIIEFSMLHFSNIQLSPMLTYGPIFTVDSIIQLLPIMTGPLIIAS